MYLIYLHDVREQCHIHGHLLLQSRALIRGQMSVSSDSDNK